MSRRGAKFSELVGLTLAKFEVSNDDDIVTIESVDGRSFQLHHWQSCCESVTIDDVCGDVENLIGSPILQAEESSSDTPPAGARRPDVGYVDGSETWTFYRLSTVKGLVVLRWYGSSNGYYSESVDFKEAT